MAEEEDPEIYNGKRRRKESSEGEEDGINLSLSMSTPNTCRRSTCNSTPSTQAMIDQLASITGRSPLPAVGAPPPAEDHATLSSAAPQVLYDFTASLGKETIGQLIGYVGSSPFPPAVNASLTAEHAAPLPLIGFSAPPLFTSVFGAASPPLGDSTPRRYTSQEIMMPQFPSFSSSSPPVPQPSPQPVAAGYAPLPAPPVALVPYATTRVRHNPTQAPRTGKDEKIEPPFLWATNRRAVVHSLSYLQSKEITSISGEVQCRQCDFPEVISYDLDAKFKEVVAFICGKQPMNDRAPAEWMNPAFGACRSCGQANCMRPVIAEKRRSINWLFMFLGQTLGCCSLKQLKYFCKHNKFHRTGAKNRVLFYAYISLCKQLDPTTNYDI